MRRHAALTLFLVLALGATAAGEEEREASSARPAIPQVVEIPARTVEVEREVYFPAVVKRICTPIYEVVEVPIETTRLKPRFEEQEVPVYAWRLVPIYHTVERPVHGTELEPLYVPVKRRVSLPVCSPFACSCTKIPLYEKCAKVQVAWLEKETIEGYRQDSVPRGMRRERYVARTETRRVQVGEDVEVVRVGTRTERRLKGYDTEVIELAPARTEIVTETVTLPARRVTLAPVGIEAAPLPGTDQVVTPTELAALDATR